LDISELYTVTNTIKSDSETVSAQVELNANHAIFKGHFPLHPVLPGVAVIEMVKELLESHLRNKLLLQIVTRIKFAKLVNPEEHNTLCFQLNFQAENDLLKVKINSTFVDGTPVMNGSIVFLKK